MSNTNEFIVYMQLAKSHQGELRTIYRSIISIISELKERSKMQMHQISDLDEGLDLSLNHEESDKKNVAILTQYIIEFNATINEVVQHFNAEYDLILSAYQNALLAYSNHEEEKKILLQAKRELVFLDKLLRRFRENIAALQQMNNVLFSFSEEFKKVKDEYGLNLSKANSTISTAIDDSYKVIEQIQLVDVSA